MKKPEESKATKSDKPSTRKAAETSQPDQTPDTATSQPADKPDDTPDGGAAGSARKAAATPGTLKSTDTGKGDGSSAAAAGSTAGPVASQLVGDGSSDTPAAQPKRKQSDPGPTGALKDVPPEAILRDTPVADPTPTQNVTVRKTGFWQMLLGGACAAALGALAAIWVWPQTPAEAVDTASIRAEAVAAAKEAAGTEIAALRDELASAAPAPDTNAQAAVEALQQQLDEQAQRLDELAARPALEPGMAQRIQDLAAQAQALEGQIQAAAEQAQSRITAAQSEAEKMQAAATDSTRRAEAVAAIASLQAALDRGVTPDEARQTLEGAGMDAPEPLTREVPSLVSLQSDFPQAARAALRDSLREAGADGGNALTRFFRAQTGARSVAPRAGDDPDAILSRANAEVEKGRIDAALTEMAALPESAKSAPAMAGWLTRAQTYADAKAALNALSAPSN